MSRAQGKVYWLLRHLSLLKITHELGCFARFALVSDCLRTGLKTYLGGSFPQVRFFFRSIWIEASTRLIDHVYPTDWQRECGEPQEWGRVYDLTSTLFALYLQYYTTNTLRRDKCNWSITSLMLYEDRYQSSLVRNSRSRNVAWQKIEFRVLIQASAAPKSPHPSPPPPVSTLTDC